MPQSAPRILSVGSDHVLCDTRHKVLQRQYEVVSVNTIEEMQQLPSKPAFTIVILCHTLSDTDCLVAASIARQRWPRARILSLVTNGGSYRPSLVADFTLINQDGPRALLNAIDALQTISPRRPPSPSTS